MSVSSLLGPALLNSLKLAAVAFVLVVPLSIVGGVFAALRRGRISDRVITLTGLSLTAVPEFVSAIMLILVFGLVLKLLPVTAAAPRGCGLLHDRSSTCLLPAMALVMVLFGYIARMARAGTIEALDADYTRTAFLKGIPTRTVLFRHVLRNSLLPTIAVIATQTGYLIGGLVVIETLFNYNGIGQRILTRGSEQGRHAAPERGARDRDRLPRRDADRRHPLLRAQPADPLRRPPNEHDRRAGRPGPDPGLRQEGRAARDDARARALEDLRGRESRSSSGGSSARSSATRSRPRTRSTRPRACSRARAGTTCSAPISSAATCSRGCSPARASILTIAPLATLLAIAGGTSLGLVTGYFRGIVDDVRRAGSSTRSSRSR